MPHVAFDDRFLVDRLHRFDGLYVATVSFGYRDKLDLSDIAPPLRNRIVALESRAQQDADELKEKIRKIDEALRGAVTHMCVVTVVCLLGPPPHADARPAHRTQHQPAAVLRLGGPLSRPTPPTHRPRRPPLPARRGLPPRRR